MANYTLGDFRKLTKDLPDDILIITWNTNSRDLFVADPELTEVYHHDTEYTDYVSAELEVMDKPKHKAISI